MGMEAQAPRLIAEAKKFATAAGAEFSRWEKERKDEIIRDAAEKAWNAVVQATNALLAARGYPEEALKSHRARRESLEELQIKEPSIARRFLRDRYGAREYYLHERCFYDGEYRPDTIRDEIRKVLRFIRDVEGLMA